MKSNSFYTSVERHGKNILWRGVQDGKRFAKKVKFEPELFLETRNPEEYSGFVDLYKNKPLKRKTFEDMREASDFLAEYKDVSGFTIYGNSNYLYQFIQQNYPDEIHFDYNKIITLKYDIEVDISEKYPDMDEADNEITSIAAKFSNSEKYYLFGRKPFDKNKTDLDIDPELIEYVFCNSEKELIRKFVLLWESNHPDIITGWNVEYFDTAYFVTRLIRVLGEEYAKRLSPWGIAPRKKTTKTKWGKETYTWHIVGIAILDYMLAFKKFGYKFGPQETYKLDHIAYVVLGEKKMDYSEYSGLTELYEKNPQKYLSYNLKDTWLIQRMEDETALIQLVITVAYMAGANYNDSFGTVGIWDANIFRELMKKKRLAPVKGSPGEKINFVGGYVRDPKLGIHRHVVSFDLDALYPHNYLQYNMSPETYLTDEFDYEINIEAVLNGIYKNKNQNMAVCPNGACFDKTVEGILPAMIKDLYAFRKQVKTRMLKLESQAEKNKKDNIEDHAIDQEIVQLFNKQMAVKIFLNSLYGASGNVYFPFYIPKMAEAITTSGQLAVRTAMKSVNSYLNSILKTKDKDYILYGDTDSIYVDMGPLVEKVYGTLDISNEEAEQFLDKACSEKIAKVISKGYDDLAEQVGAYTNAMSMKREKISDKTIFTGKKRYIMSTLNSEGVHYDTPKISVTGLESVRSSTPEICRNKMKESFEIILRQGEAASREFVENFKKEFSQMDANLIAKNSGLDNLYQYMEGKTYTKGCPIHVRGAITYNNLIERKKLSRKYPLIQEGEKIKFVYLKLPNVARENVISFPGYLPSELGLDEYIDYDSQFDVVFKQPMKLIFEAIGWEIEERATLDSFFG